MFERQLTVTAIGSNQTFINPAPPVIAPARLKQKGIVRVVLEDYRQIETADGVAIEEALGNDQRGMGAHKTDRHKEGLFALWGCELTESLDGPSGIAFVGGKAAVCFTGEFNIVGVFPIPAAPAVLLAIAKVTPLQFYKGTKGTVDFAKIIPQWRWGHRMRDVLFSVKGVRTIVRFGFKLVPLIRYVVVHHLPRPKGVVSVSLKVSGNRARICKDFVFLPVAHSEVVGAVRVDAG